MNNLLKKLWNDDAGALIAAEFLFIATILVTGIIVGLVTVRNAVSAELAEHANAILALSQGYSFAGLVGCCASVDGSQAIDTPFLFHPTRVDPVFCVPAASPSIIDLGQFPCE